MPTKTSKPELGRIVRYQLPKDHEAINGARVFPAVICRVFEGNVVNLRVFTDDCAGRELPWVGDVPHDHQPDFGRPAPATWCWPDRS